jgi:hypothetical protein
VVYCGTNRVNQGMAQIIDMEEERRKPRRALRALPERPRLPPSVDPGSYLDQFAAPSAVLWRSWFATWGSLWLAPFGLQVSTLEERRPADARERAKPRT